jgi:hypothetical protein
VVVTTGRERVETDAEGCAQFPCLATGPAELLAVAHGFTPTIVRVQVGATRTVEIREDEPRIVRVTVRAEDGSALPSACVLATCESIRSPSGSSCLIRRRVAQIEGDVEDLWPRTDSSGVVVLRVPRGNIRYAATLGDTDDDVVTEDDAVEFVLRDPYQ